MDAAGCRGELKEVHSQFSFLALALLVFTYDTGMCLPTVELNACKASCQNRSEAV